MDTVELTLQNDPRAVLSPREWALASFLSHQSPGGLIQGPRPGSKVSFCIWRPALQCPQSGLYAGKRLCA